MITSVTSATAAATSVVASWGLTLAVGGALLVIGMLIALDVLGDAQTGWRAGLRRAIRIATAPLIFVFALSIVAKTFAVLG